MLDFLFVEVWKQLALSSPQKWFYLNFLQSFASICCFLFKSIALLTRCCDISEFEWKGCPSFSFLQGKTCKHLVIHLRDNSVNVAPPRGPKLREEILASWRWWIAGNSIPWVLIMNWFHIFNPQIDFDM